MKWMRLLGVALPLCLTACSEKAETTETSATVKVTIPDRIGPNIVVGDVADKDREALASWIEESLTLFKSQAFEQNFLRGAEHYPEVYVSKAQDIIPTPLLLKRLKTQDPYLSSLWWPKSFVVLKGDTATRSENRTGFGFEALRTASAGPYPENEIGTRTGEIKLGRLHFARYTQGDVVEKSCAMNTMVHEMSHTLSDQADIFWMHILDTETNVTPPRGVFEASYYVGIIAQCTYLENMERLDKSEFENCIKTFSDPENASRFRSIACDDFPSETPIMPSNRIKP